MPIVWALPSAFPICPVASRCWPHTGPLYVPPDLCPKCTLLYMEGYSQFPPCLANTQTLLVHISPSKPTASSHDYIQLLLLTCESEHITRPYFVGSSLCWGPAIFSLSLCTHCSFYLCHCPCQALTRQDVKPCRSLV